MDPILHELKLSEFDLDLLPLDRELLQSDPALLRQAVCRCLETLFGKLGGEARVEVRGETVKIAWMPPAAMDNDQVRDLTTALLKAGSRDLAIPLLKALTDRSPDDAMVRYNYGIVLSDKGKLDEAVSHLRRAVEIGPNDANTWNALGLAYERRGEVEQALKALEHSLSLDPENGYSLRNLGGLLAKTDPAKGLPYLRKAALLLPGDQVTQYNFGLCLIKAGQSKEADRVLAAAVEVAPHTRLAQRCEELRNNISNDVLRAGTGDGLRMDAVTHCLSALKTLRELGPERFRAITVEIALLGQDGLDINNPTRKYTLRSLPGQFSGMQLVSYMYVGFRHLAPDDDAGIDLSREYDAAKLVVDGKQPS